MERVESRFNTLKSSILLASSYLFAINHTRNGHKLDKVQVLHLLEGTLSPRRAGEVKHFSLLKVYEVIYYYN